MRKHELGLITGYHGPEKELRFVDDVVNDIKSKGYKGSIKLIGSRAKGKWIATVNFDKYCRDFPPEIFHYWYQLLNSLAMQQQLISRDVPSLIDQIGDNVPKEIIEFLQPLSDPASDFDILIETGSPKIPNMYYDRDLEQNVDVKTQAEFSSYLKSQTKS